MIDYSNYQPVYADDMDDYDLYCYMETGAQLSGYVGIVSGPTNIPLYCRVDGNIYSVINGGWEFVDRGDGIRPIGAPNPTVITDWKIVLRNMKSYNYNHACELIKEATKSSKVGK